VKNLEGKKVLVVGLARSGRAAIERLLPRGAQLTVTDLSPPAALGAELRDLAAKKVGLEIGMHRTETFENQDLIVVSPGVPADSPYLQAARARNIPIVPEIEVASWLLASPLVGVTGSNGKTTTTTLIGKMLESSRIPAAVAGNIGVPLISLVDAVPREKIIVTELSSFQLEVIRDFRPQVSVLLNITPNHLDRHGTMEAYVEAKAQVFRNQTPEDLAVLNADDPVVRSLAPRIRARKVYFSRQMELPDGLFVSRGRVIYRAGNLERPVLETRDVKLRGEFNLENVLAAAATACVLGADFAALRRAVQEFRGVEHRLEFVREVHGVAFFNDSKATSVDAAAKALSAFEGGVHLILGGKDKGAPYAPLAPLIARRARGLYLIGAAAERIARELSGTVEIVPAGDLETAVLEAFSRAEAGETILLSPACASFDQFENFEHRGRVFKDVVERIAAEVSRLELERMHSQHPFALRSEPPAAAMNAEAAPPEQAAEAEAPTPSEPALSGAAEVAEAPSRAAPVEAAETLPEAATEVPAPAEDASVPPSTPAQPAGTESAAGEERAAEPRELVYVYEIGAEEMPPADEQVLLAGEDSELLSPADLQPTEPVEDEAMPFEVTVKSAGARGGNPPAGSGPGGSP
jgi:UDP-N-acetylmuramoylalanine--D-glutamate ligase